MCRGCLEWLLKLLNFLLTITGLAMVGYGIYLLVEWNRISGDGDDPISPVSSNPEILALGRPMLLVVSLSESILDKLPKAWYASFQLAIIHCIYVELASSRLCSIT